MIISPITQLTPTNWNMILTLTISMMMLKSKLYSHKTSIKMEMWKNHKKLMKKW